MSLTINDISDLVNRSVDVKRVDELRELIDTTITDPTPGQLLTYNGSKWVNADSSSISVPSTQTIGSSTVNNVSVVPTTGFSGLGGAEETMGGVAMGKNHIVRDGSTNPAYSSAITFGPPSASTGVWRMVSVQPTDGTNSSNYSNTYLTLETKLAGVWTKSMSFFHS